VVTGCRTNPLNRVKRSLGAGLGDREGNQLARLEIETGKLSKKRYRSAHANSYIFSFLLERRRFESLAAIIEGNFQLSRKMVTVGKI
jgi:hypothetical protein